MTETTDLDRERELLEDDLLPSLEHQLGEEYDLVRASDRYQDEFQQIAAGKRSIEDYELPTVTTPEFGVLFPEYFIVKDDHPMSYAAAIEPHTKYVHIQDDALTDVMRDFATSWKQQSYIDEINLGRANVSDVSFAENESSTVFAERL